MHDANLSRFWLSPVHLLWMFHFPTICTAHPRQHRLSASTAHSYDNKSLATKITEHSRSRAGQELEYDCMSKLESHVVYCRQHTKRSLEDEDELSRRHSKFGNLSAQQNIPTTSPKKDASPFRATNIHSQHSNNILPY
jgi:hypothetical protein